MSKKNLLLILLLCISTIALTAQPVNRAKIHSHNDYVQKVPFWSAYANGLNSIEVDIFLKNDRLYVTHGESEIIQDRTLENLYLQPIQKAVQLKLGQPQELQLLVDIKSEPYATLEKLISILENYPNLINDRNISIVISGNRPKVNEYVNYPDYIHFDYQKLEDIQRDKAWNKVALISLNFKKFSPWNGKGRLTAEDYKKVKAVIDKAHSYGKPFRFWGAPDSKTAWKAFSDMGVDFINTDLPYASASYLNTLGQRVFYNTVSSEVYTPTFESDQKNRPVKNVILLIGDGNGLTQISSSVLANGGDLTLTQLKSIGFLKTQSADDFTTDSAAAGTALATGTKTNNRAIGVDAQDNSLKNIAELLNENGFNSGCITTDDITGATPAAFYAHRKDRSDEAGIISDLSKSKLSLLIGGGSNALETGIAQMGFSILESTDRIAKSDEKRVAHFISKDGVPGILEGRGAILAEATKNGLTFLKAKKAPFFLMVEGAKIDSYGHENSVPGIVSEGIDFDRAITEALKFADVTGNTLVVVTADHETSGFSIPQGNLENRMVEGDFTTHDHTGTMVPLFAYGPHSQEFQGVYENTEVYDKIIKVLKIKAD
ncbi:alkaline phosphatase [Ulvibacterium marinum]|uniref:Alkaline phosphatase n=1 Tax=Ulvibacterium marinum TaxID=2419782 RepID=A0A3B0CDC6_9FLAO|nr:alkaline phosphatase [Ulvibacterium marinum]RKN82514.1 alkaline phosphatase [Ulvibacterium marinum]